MTGSPHIWRAVLAVLAVGALVAALVPTTAAAAQQRKPRLTAFGSCTSLLNYARTNARRTGGTTGVPTRAGFVEPLAIDAPGDALPAPVLAPSAAADKASPEFSGTNVQEAGVDEPDVVKTDGKRIFAIANGKLHALDATGGAPKLLGTLALTGDGHQIFLRGDRVLVMTSAGSFATADFAGPVERKATLTEVDVSNPAAMSVRRTLLIDGGFVDARLTGSLARIVVVSSPDPIALRKIGRAGLRRWVPRTVLRSKVSGRTFKRTIAPCRAVRRPRSFSGLDLLTVMTFDLDKGLYSVDRDAMLAGAQTVYASATSLYVASQTYRESVEDGRVLPRAMRTEIHRFSAPANGKTSYRASGEVRGFVLNQFALSEHGGVLRVASTSEPEWFPDGSSSAPSQSYVTVLDERGSRLMQIGRVGGLGRGEQIYAVRFAGERGYVVTFRRVDPLYTLDLSKPSKPRVAGELKIRGYSAYLHPVSDDLLLGVGQDATSQGATLGTQLSLFDVSDASKPVRRAQITLGDSYSEAEFDHHAFLYWDPAKLAVIPLTGFGSDGTLSFEGAVGFRLDPASLAEAGRVTHPATVPEQRPWIGRSLVIGDRLYTLSYAGLQASRLDTLAPLSFAAFPAG